MVTTEVAQLSNECNAWRETLRSHREKFGHLKTRLMKIASQHTLKEDLLQVEHLDNQLHIQLINIHDLKQSIKAHDKQIHHEISLHPGKVSDEVIAGHEKLYDEFQHLESTLQELEQEFELFMEKGS